MKHQSAISIQRITNMKSGITEAQRFLDIYKTNLDDKIKQNRVLLTDTNELDEILDLLDWIKNQ